MPVIPTHRRPVARPSHLTSPFSPRPISIHQEIATSPTLTLLQRWSTSPFSTSLGFTSHVRLKLGLDIHPLDSQTSTSIINTTANVGPAGGGRDPQPDTLPEEKTDVAILPFSTSLNTVGFTSHVRPKLKLDIHPLDSQTSAPIIKIAAKVGPAGGSRDPQPDTLAEEKTDGSDWVTELEAIKRLNSICAIEMSDDAFEVLCRLGESADGIVSKIRHTQSGMILVRRTIATPDVPGTQILRELNNAASCDHPNIIKCIGIYKSPSGVNINILTEFCEGRSLDAIGKQHKELGAVPREKIYGRMAEGILQGLNYLHKRRIIHRDIKPQNVFLSREGIVKLCDFATSGELLNSFAGTFTGTCMYMAPERIAGADYTINSDVWSTGITLLELALGRNPYPPELPQLGLMMYITSCDPPRLEDENGRCWSDEMKDFFKQALTADRHVRPTPKDMLQHVWMTTVMTQEVRMDRWIRTVWGWPKLRHSRDKSASSTNSTPSRSRDTQCVQ